MRTKCRSIATFHRPIHSHWSLPLSLRTLKIMPRNFNEIVRSWIRLLYMYGIGEKFNEKPHSMLSGWHFLNICSLPGPYCCTFSSCSEVRFSRISLDQHAVLYFLNSTFRYVSATHKCTITVFIRNIGVGTKWLIRYIYRYLLTVIVILVGNDYFFRKTSNGLIANALIL
jgi:hypothetical protein